MTQPLLLAAALALLVGCAANEPRKKPPKDTEYQSRPAGVRQTRADAERAYAGTSAPAKPGEAWDTPPKVLSARFPDYPPALRRAEITGDVLVRFTVEKDGSVGDLTVLGSPPKELAALVLAAVARWTFSPATKDGVPVRAQLVQPFRFDLE